MTHETATMEAAATQRPFNTDLREFERDSVAGEGKFPVRLADFRGAIDVRGRSNGGWARVHDRAIGVVIGIALAGVIWVGWTIVVTQ